MSGAAPVKRQKTSTVPSGSASASAAAAASDPGVDHSVSLVAKDLTQCLELPDLRMYEDAGNEWKLRDDIPDEVVNAILEDDLKKAFVQSMVDEKSKRKSQSAAAAAAAATSGSAAATASASASAAVAVKPSPAKRPAAAASSKQSLEAKNQLLHSENYLTETGWATELSIARLYTTVMSDCTVESSCYVKTGYPRQAIDMIATCKNNGVDIQTALVKPAVLLYTVNIQCGKQMSQQYAGNHYVALVIDSRRYAQIVSKGKGMIYYWDPLGRRMELDDLREALQERFKGFVIHDTPCQVQDDSFQCPIWVAVYLRQFKTTIDSTDYTAKTNAELCIPFTLFQWMTNDAFYNLSNGYSDQKRRVNREYISAIRKKWVQRIRKAPTHTSQGENLAPLFDT